MDCLLDVKFDFSLEEAVQSPTHSRGYLLLELDDFILSFYEQLVLIFIHVHKLDVVVKSLVHLKQN